MPVGPKICAGERFDNGESKHEASFEPKDTLVVFFESPSVVFQCRSLAVIRFNNDKANKRRYKRSTKNGVKWWKFKKRLDFLGKPSLKNKGALCIQSRR